jgi:hypothetical protein
LPFSWANFFQDYYQADRILCTKDDPSLSTRSL